MIRASIILLTYNSQDTIEACLTSLKDNYTDNFEKGKFEIIVADNNSQDATNKVTKDFFKTNPDIKFQHIQNKENFGFAKGINRAAEKAGGKYMLFLNPDTKVKNNMISGMLDYMEEDEATGIMGGRLITPQKKIEKSAGKDFDALHILLLSAGLDTLFGMRRAPEFIQEVDWISGGCMLVRKKTFTSLNGFDEKYFMYVEDADICRRARDAMYKVVYFPEFIVEHESHASGSRTFAITNIYKGLFRYSDKFHGQFRQFLVQFLLMGKARMLITLATVTGDNKLHATYTQALKAK